MSPEMAAKFETLKADLWEVVMKNHEADFLARRRLDDGRKYDDAFRLRKEQGA